MRQILFGIATFLCLATSAWALDPPASGKYAEGVHYNRLASPQPGGGEEIEVIEFFWYGCPHCADFDPFIQSWKKSKPEGVKFTLVPAVFMPEWEVGAKAFYALQMLDALEVHSRVFDQIHKERKPHQTAEHYAEIVAGLGVDKQKFLDALKSFVVDAKVRRARQMIRDYRIMGVPTLAVNGKYTTSASMAGGNQAMLRVLDHLVALEKAS
ncbi:MAG TPA: thiol:disulfide interchange protein DsbA/DsbL [Gammaproteobacteria bacterium]